ncbi:MAG: hypothetical protein UU87_C0005G0015 [Parcubacteria group bacterium GW2011_GWA2_42_11]|nr:MAG: hypothetical protein UU87_C0005G0015 [Parcubacteria group bacterium GW2011_GWA2_42_11]
MEKKSAAEKIKLIIDLKIYPLEAVYGAAYVFVDRAYLFLEPAGNNKVAITFQLKSGANGKLPAIAGEFNNELLNYAFRLNLAKENKKIRQYIIEQALFAAAETPAEEFSASGLGYGEEDDPLGIAVPWEEKYGLETENKESLPLKAAPASAASKKNGIKKTQVKSNPKKKQRPKNENYF